MRRPILAIAPVCVVTLAGSAQGATVFFDNFNAENGGVGVLNYNGFANWTVTRQSVDLIGNGFFDFFPGNGLYVDLDGSTGSAGRMESVGINLAAGTYEFSFDLAGSQRGDAPFNTVNLGIELGVLSDTIMLASAVPFTSYSYLFTINAATTVNIVFDHLGGDNIGLLLDNVRIATADPVIPAPLASLLAGAGLFGAMGVRRRAYR